MINTYNAAPYLDKVLQAVGGFDEVLVCDMESTDGTVRIAEAHGCRVITFQRKDCRIVEPARQYAIDRASNPWVLVVDADEIVTSELRDYLYAKVREADCPQGIAIPRKNYFMGRFMHSCYPDYVLRFFRKDKTTWPPVIHASPKVDGTVERIPRGRKDLALEHLANDSVGVILQKTNTYSDYELVRRRKKHYGLGALLMRPTFRFFKSYVLKGGCLDGIPGFLHAVLDAVYQFSVVAKLMEERTK